MRVPAITRTIKTKIVTAMVANKATCQLEEHVVTVPSSVSNLEKYLKKELNGELVFVSIKEVVETSQKYKMSISAFLEVATPVDNDSDDETIEE